MVHITLSHGSRCRVKRYGGGGYPPQILLSLVVCPSRLTNRIGCEDSATAGKNMQTCPTKLRENGVKLGGSEEIRDREMYCVVGGSNSNNWSSCSSFVVAEQSSSKMCCEGTWSNLFRT